MDITKLIGQFELRLTTAFLLGAAIGLERQWHNKLAGIRTNALVSVGAALFVLVGESIMGDSSSAARIASQVVSGIGFLGAGVIMREGLNVTGLNTAATVWCAGAVGLLAGMGQWYQSVVGTLFVLSSHFLLRPIGDKIDAIRAGEQKPFNHLPEVYLYRLTLSCENTYANETRSRLLHLLNRSNKLQMHSFETSTTPNGQGLTMFTARIQAQGQRALLLDKLVKALLRDAHTLNAQWEEEGHTANGKA